MGDDISRPQVPPDQPHVLSIRQHMQYIKQRMLYYVQHSRHTLTNSIAYLLGGELKAKILRTLATNPGTAYHLRGLAAAAGVESGNAHKALKGLIQAQLVKTVSDARGARYQIDSRSPLAEPLRQLFLAASQLMTDLKDAAQSLPADRVLIFGSVAKGTDTPESDIDVLVIGRLSSIEAQAAFSQVSRKHGREINVLAVEPEAMAEQIAQGSEFWKDIVNSKVIMLKGEDIHASVSTRAVTQ